MSESVDDGPERPAGFFMVKASRAVYVEVAMAGADPAATGKRFEALLAEVGASGTDVLGTDGKTLRMTQFDLAGVAAIRGYAVKDGNRLDS